jgi:flagellin
MMRRAGLESGVKNPGWILMSTGVVLSAAVRQNLLSLQQTAQLLATTQNDLATGNKINSALDNPTDYFTSQGLNTRATELSSLQDGISNGVQVLQAANTGITSLTTLVSDAQSIANQALQAPIGYDTKSNYSTTIGGATAANLLGTTTYANAVASSNVLYDGAAGGTTAASATTTLGGVSGLFTGAATANNNAGVISAATGIEVVAASNTLVADPFTNGDQFTVNGKTITVSTGTPPTSSTVTSGSGVSTDGNIVTDGNGNSTVYITSTTTVGDFLNAIDLASGVQTATITAGAATFAVASGQTASTVSGAGAIKLQSTTGSDLTITGKADDLKALGLTTATGSGNATVQAFRTTSSATLSSLIQSGSTLNVDGKTITFTDAATPTASGLASGSSEKGNVVTDGNGNSTVYLQKATVADVLNAIDLATGAQYVSSIASGVATLATATGSAASSINTAGQLNISTGVASDLNITGSGNVLSALGLAGNTGTDTSFTASRNSTPGSLSGKTLTFSSFNGGTAINVTFGNGSNGTVQTLTQLNAALQADNLIASVNSTGTLTVAAANDYASSTLGSTAAGGTIGGTASTALTWTTASAPVADASSQTTRANLVSQYNNILDQINKTAEDSSYNGINLLNGDQLQLTFDETGKATLSITGTTANASGLGLAALTQGTDFVDNNSTNQVLAALQTATSSLQSLASSLGSNLSVVQNRQSFNTSLINVLQTGASNLTIADSNEEAAASQALSTRQSIAVSALALSNQDQQSVLQLLR